MIFVTVWPERDSNPWPPRYRCSVLPTELSSHSPQSVKIYEIPYIHLYYSPSTGALRTNKWPAPSWLDSSVARTLHQYRRGPGAEVMGSNPVQVWTFFPALTSYHSPHFKYMKFHIFTSSLHYGGTSETCLRSPSALRQQIYSQTHWSCVVLVLPFFLSWGGVLSER